MPRIEPEYAVHMVLRLPEIFANMVTEYHKFHSVTCWHMDDHQPGNGDKRRSTG